MATKRKYTEIQKMIENNTLEKVRKKFKKEKKTEVELLWQHMKVQEIIESQIKDLHKYTKKSNKGRVTNDDKINVYRKVHPVLNLAWDDVLRTNQSVRMIENSLLR